MPVPSYQFMGGRVATAALSAGDRYHAEQRERERREADALKQAGRDIWMSMRRFNGKPDQVNFVGYA